MLRPDGIFLLRSLAVSVSGLHYGPQPCSCSGLVIFIIRLPRLGNAMARSMRNGSDDDDDDGTDDDDDVDGAATPTTQLRVTIKQTLYACSRSRIYELCKQIGRAVAGCVFAYVYEM